jgi:hypothetical protein
MRPTNNKLCETKPISERPKMKLTPYPTNDYENKSGLLTTAKQTQSNPILPNSLTDSQKAVRLFGSEQIQEKTNNRDSGRGRVRQKHCGG